jgi:hypothetical protein
MIASEKMNAAVAVRKSSPTRTAVFLLDVVRGPLCCIVRASIIGVFTVDIRKLLVVYARLTEVIAPGRGCGLK